MISVKKIELAINTIEDDKYAITDLCKYFKKYKSDKAYPDDIEEKKQDYHIKCKNKEMSVHNYSNFYDKIFKNVRNKKINLFEMGIGSRDPNVDSNMCHMNYEESLSLGCSVNAWSDYFRNANVYAADIDEKLIFENKEKRIKTFYCDQNSKEDFLKIMKEINCEFDIIIDDGRHTPEANLNFFKSSFGFLKKGGIYIIEDVMLTNYIPRKNNKNNKKTLVQMHDSNLKYIKSHASFVKLVKLDGTINTRDNNIIIIKK
tara:strand:- start:1495 stop:2271 length:777 start_codon:yes stop_codon:yes gene_type:complete